MNTRVATTSLETISLLTVSYRNKGNETMEEQSILASKAYKRAETNLKDKLKPTFLKHYPHHLVPGYNLHNNVFVDDVDLENVVEQCQDYPYHCDLPKPLLPPARLPRTGKQFHRMLK